MSGRLSRTVLAVLLAGTLLSAWGLVSAQEDQRDRPDRRRMSPEERQQRMEEWRQRMNDRLRQDLGFSEEEWKAVQPLYEKVVTLQRQSRGGFGGMMVRFRRRGDGQRDGGEDGDRPERPTDPSELGKARTRLAEVAENDAATSEQIQAAVKDYRAARDKLDEQLEQARKELRSVLNARQEAKLLLRGVLK